MAELGTGTTITFSTGFFAEIISVAHNGWERGSIDTTHMGTTTARTFTPTDLYDPGVLEVELAFVPATTPVTPMTAAPATVTLTFPDAGSATLAATGHMESFEITDPLEDKITARARIKFSGPITYTP